MKELLFTNVGRINRQKFWLALFYQLIASIIVGIVFGVLAMIFPGDVTADGSFHVTGLKAIPYLIVGIGYAVFSFWAGLCVAIKRYHDRGKSGWWILIMLVPIVGGIWYFIETGCLRGTDGPNAYGPDPLAA